ncbi:hypothetical protein GmHk_01G000954 [Glycine max]|nr:hypothetical protein GmHk_01G000954 [Glycine max]
MGPDLPDSQRPFLGGYTQKGTGHPETKHCPPTFCLVGVMNIWSRSSWLRRRKRSWRKLHSQEALMASSTLHPIRRHVKWKMARTKKTGEMTTEATKEIAEKIDVLTTAIGCPEHLGRVRVAGAGVTIKQYFGSAPRTSRSSSSLPPEELQQLTQQIRDQLEESITEKVMRQLMASFSQMQSQMQSQGLALPP